MTKHNLNTMLRETLGASFLLVAVLVLAFHYHALPSQIHTPFNGGGDAHGMGSRSHLWLLIVVGGWIYVLMSLLNLMPTEAVNLPRPLTPDQRQGVLDNAKSFLGWFKAFLMGGLALWMCFLVR